MAAIEFNGSTIMDDAEGTFIPTVGIRQPVWEEVQLVRADGELGKLHGVTGCDHILELTYLHAVNVQTIRERLAELAQSTVSGQLVIDAIGTYSNCRVKAVSDLVIKREVYTLTAGMAYSTRWTVQATVTFRQMR